MELFGASVQMPAFTRCKTQLHPIELEKTRALAHCWINVEREIGTLKQKYTILNDIISISLLRTNTGNNSVLDQILFVFSALVNFCLPIIPL